MRLAAVVMLVLALPFAAHAQWAQEPYLLTPPDLNAPDFLVGGRPPATAVYYLQQTAIFPCENPGLVGRTCAAGNLVPRESFAHANQVYEQITEINRQTTRALKLAAISAAIGDAVPNPGDSYAFRFNIAMIRDHPAAAFGFAANILGTGARLTVNHGRAKSEHLTTIGVNLSFR